MQDPQAFDGDKRKLLSAVAHGSIFVSATFVAIAIPIALYFVADDPIVKDNAKEAINFHFNVWLYGLILVPLSFITFGLAGGLWWLIHWGLTVWAILHCFNVTDQAFRYPFIFRPL
jgi:uncharacterized Tic20 family protein